MWKLKYDTNSLQNRNRLTYRLVVAKVEGLGKDDCKCGVSRCKLVYVRRINNKVLLYGTGN